MMIERLLNKQKPCLSKAAYPYIFCILFISMFSSFTKADLLIEEPSGKNDRAECVILLHGMSRTSRSMVKMQSALTEAGFYTVNLGYPSTKKDIESITADHLPPALAQCQHFSPTAIHFVTHSLGGIIVRQALTGSRPVNLGRVVMLSPPNQGSALVDRLKDWWLYGWLNGPAGQQLTTEKDSLPNTLGRVDYPVGVITGDRHAFFDTWFSTIIPGTDDGKVSVAQAKVDGMSDFMVVHQSHPFIMNSDYVKSQTIHFLRHGVFNKLKEPPISKLSLDWFSASGK